MDLVHFLETVRLAHLKECMLAGEEQENVAVLLRIVTLLRQMHTVTVPKKKLWRLTKDETRSAFLARVATASEIATSCTQRVAFNDSKEKEETLDMLEQGQAESRRRRRNAVIKVLLQAATLTFLAEWGDRSQLATVVLATREHVVGVVIGGSLGHALCTGLAVIGGRMVASKISVRTVTIIGGLVFLFFAVSALVIGPGD